VIRGSNLNQRGLTSGAIIIKNYFRVNRTFRYYQGNTDCYIDVVSRLCGNSCGAFKLVLCFQFSVESMRDSLIQLAAGTTIMGVTHPLQGSRFHE
jgi:hypothetical protein